MEKYINVGFNNTYLNNQLVDSKGWNIENNNGRINAEIRDNNNHAILKFDKKKLKDVLSRPSDNKSLLTRLQSDFPLKKTKSVKFKKTHKKAKKKNKKKTFRTTPHPKKTTAKRRESILKTIY